MREEVFVQIRAENEAAARAAAERPLDLCAPGRAWPEERVPVSVPSAVVAVVMGSRSDWATMRHAAAVLEELQVPHLDPDRLRPPHAGASLRLRPRRPRRRASGDHRRSRRCGSLAGHDRGPDDAAGPGRAGRERGAEGRGQPALDRPDAGRGARRHARDRSRRRAQCRPARGGDPGADRSAASRMRSPPGGSGRPRQSPRRRRRRDRAAAGCGDRDHGRRAARAHDRPRRRAARLSLPRPDAGGGQPGGRSLRRASPALLTTIRRHSPASPRPWTWSRSSSRTCRWPHLRSWPAQVPVRPGPDVLRVTQDRLLEKRFVTGLGIAVTEFVAVDDAAGLAEARWPTGARRAEDAALRL